MDEAILPPEIIFMIMDNTEMEAFRPFLRVCWACYHHCMKISGQKIKEWTIVEKIDQNQIIKKLPNGIKLLDIISGKYLRIDKYYFNGEQIRLERYIGESDYHLHHHKPNVGSYHYRFSDTGSLYLVYCYFKGDGHFSIFPGHNYYSHLTDLNCSTNSKIIKYFKNFDMARALNPTYIDIGLPEAHIILRPEDENCYFINMNKNSDLKSIKYMDWEKLSLELGPELVAAIKNTVAQRIKD